MKLYDVPRNTRVRVISNPCVPIASRQLPKGEVLLFHNLDGIYSCCTDSNNKVVHLAGDADVEIVGDR